MLTKFVTSHCLLFGEVKSAVNRLVGVQFVISVVETLPFSARFPLPRTDHGGEHLVSTSEDLIFM